MSGRMAYRRAGLEDSGGWHWQLAASGTRVWAARRRALVHLEVLASIGLTIVLATLFAVATLQYATARRENDTRRLLQLAATAELDRIRAGIRPVPIGQPDRPPASQPGEVVISATAKPGEGPWRGLTRVRVVASKRMGANRTIEVELTAFVARGGQP